MLLPAESTATGTSGSYILPFYQFLHFSRAILISGQDTFRTKLMLQLSFFEQDQKTMGLLRDGKLPRISVSTELFDFTNQDTEAKIILNSSDYVDNPLSPFRRERLVSHRCYPSFNLSRNIKAAMH